MIAESLAQDFTIDGIFYLVWFFSEDFSRSCRGDMSSGFHTYIIESITTGNWYYGATSDLDTRLEYHNKVWSF